LLPDDDMSLVQTVDWLAISPALAVTAAALLVLVADLWLPARSIGARVAVGAVGLIAGLVCVALLWGQSRATFCAPEGAESCSYVVDSVTLVFQAVALAGALVVLLLAVDEVRATGLPPGEFVFLLLCSVTGAVTIAAARDLATLAVALEVVSLPGFALVGLRRRSLRSSEAALTFFLVSVISVAVMLYGVSLIYGGTGSLYLNEIASALTDPAVRENPATTVGVLLTLVGFAFKVSAVPFHFWAPDTYAGAPVTVAAYLSVVSKSAGLVGLVVIVSQGFGPYADLWGPAVAVIAALTMTVGNAVALRQRHAVRLLAWSSIAQAGYLLVPLGVAAAEPTPEVLGSALSATVAYVCIYAVVNLGAFGVVAVVARHRPEGRLSQYRGLVRTEPGSAVMLAFFLLCLAGLPPGLAGLFAKVVVFEAALDGGVGWLAVVMAVNTVVALAYYLYWTALLFASPGEPVLATNDAAPGLAEAEAPPSYRVPGSSAAALGVLLAAALVLSVVPQLILRLMPEVAAALG
jgi:NADH-quinone oxidoreductase subunit N